MLQATRRAEHAQKVELRDNKEINQAQKPWAVRWANDNPDIKYRMTLTKEKLAAVVALDPAEVDQLFNDYYEEDEDDPPEPTSGVVIAAPEVGIYWKIADEALGRRNGFLRKLCEFMSATKKADGLDAAKLREELAKSEEKSKEDGSIFTEVEKQLLVGLKTRRGVWNVFPLDSAGPSGPFRTTAAGTPMDRTVVVDNGIVQAK